MSVRVRPHPIRAIALVVLATLGIPGGEAPARASTLEASVRDFDFTTGSCDTTALDADTNVSASLSPPSANGTGSGTASAFASGGEIGGHVEMTVTGTQSNAASMGGCFDALMEIDDIVLSGPDPEATVSITIDIDGIVSRSDPGVGGSVEVRLQLTGTSTGGFPGHSSPVAGLDTSNSVSTTLSTDPITVLASEPLTATVTIHGAATVGACCDLTRFVDMDFASTVSFTRNGDVLDLPDGFTANSTDGRIVDNRFVPEPATALLLAIGMGALGLRPRRKRAPGR